jgi:hypothetical protein
MPDLQSASQNGLPAAAAALKNAVFDSAAVRPAMDRTGSRCKSPCRRVPEDTPGSSDIGNPNSREAAKAGAVEESTLIV